MTTYHYIILAIIALWTLAYFRTPLLIWANAIAVILAIYTFSPTSSFFSSFFAWTVFVLVMAPIAIPTLRRRFISDKILPIIQNAVPAISQTEKDALEAGTVWWDGDLFSGKPNWKKFLAKQSPALTSEEQAFLDGPVQTLCDKTDDWQTNHEDFDLSPQVWQYIKDNKFFGMIIPKEYGGLGFSALAHSAVVTKIASRSSTAAVTVMVPNSLGPAELLLNYGTDEQKAHYLPRLAGGQDVPCFALTGPEAGSDASSIPDTGIVCRETFEGKPDVLGIRLNWEKRYITLGPVATVLGLAFKLYDPDHLLGETENIGITLALIPTNTPGVNIGRRHLPLNLAFQNGPNSGKDVFIPIDWIIGGQQRAGEGWRMLMESLAAGRSISLPALSTGSGKLACRATGAYARIRKQFRTPIGRFEGIEEPLARMAAYTYQMEAARIVTAAAVDQGEHPSVISAIVKYNLTTRMRSIITDAMDIQGGSGICMGPRNILARIYQAVPIGITVEGANILTRSLITFGQGAMRCHPYVLKEVQAVAETDSETASIKFDKAFFGHIGFSISNVFRTLFLGLTGAFFVQAPNGMEKRFYQHTTRLSSTFALVSDIGLLILGGSLKRKEKLSGRLADVLSQMYLISATLKHFKDQGRKPTDFPLVQWSCEDALYQSQQSLMAFLDNFPNRPIAWLLKGICFPLGRAYSAPSDKLGHKIANILLEPSATRDRLTQGIYLPDSTAEVLGRLEDALVKIIKAEPIEKKITRAQRKGEITGNDITELTKDALNKEIIEQSEAETLLEADIARKDVIKVDDFAADYFSGKTLNNLPENLSNISTESAVKASVEASTKENREDAVVTKRISGERL